MSGASDGTLDNLHGVVYACDGVLACCHPAMTCMHTRTMRVNEGRVSPSITHACGTLYAGAATLATRPCAMHQIFPCLGLAKHVRSDVPPANSEQHVMHALTAHGVPRGHDVLYAQFASPGMTKAVLILVAALLPRAQQDAAAH